MLSRLTGKNNKFYLFYQEKKKCRQTTPYMCGKQVNFLQESPNSVIFKALSSLQQPVRKLHSIQKKELVTKLWRIIKSSL